MTKNGLRKFLQRAKQYCMLTKDLISLAKEFLPKLEKALKKGGISADCLYYPYGYLNLLTDVIP